MLVRVLRDLKGRGLLTKYDSVLVVGGGTFDRDSLMAAGVEHATISNLDSKETGDLAPYSWRRLDAERIDLLDGSFDWVFVHAALHHLAVPALGVCEMFRVCRKGIACVEARDSFLMRLASRLGVVEDYELGPSFDKGFGGYRNGEIPNYVYRWTEREFEKVINSFAPSHRHTFFYDYGFRIPERWVGRKDVAFLVAALGAMFPRQGNQFAFGALKNTCAQPWLTDDMRFDHSYRRDHATL